MSRQRQKPAAYLWRLLKRGENLMQRIASHAAPSKSNKLAVDSLPIESWRALSKAVGGEEKLEPANNFVRELRKVKDATRNQTYT